MEKKQTVFKKVKVTDEHVGKWMFYLTPTGFRGFGLIQYPSIVQGLYRCNDTYASHVLEEMELPSDDEVRSDIEELPYNEDMSPNDLGFQGANYILNKLS